jgi:glycosyltransferase involved in cell wall biosynthesis
LLVIPAYNECGNIGPLLREIAALRLGYDTLVVDDGSTDHTATEAGQYSEVLRLPFNQGVGAAVQAGLRQGLLRGYDVVIQVDGDGQHPPDQIAHLLETYLTSGDALVIGSRFLRGMRSHFQSTPLRRLGSRAVATTLHVLFDYRFTDPTSGFRLMSRDAMKLFAQHYPAEFPEPVSIGLALREGLTVREVPVQMRARVFGESAFRGMRGLVYVGRVLSDVVRVRMGAPGAGLPERDGVVLSPWSVTAGDTL